MLPDTVENISIREDPDIKVRSEDLMESSNLLIPEESVRHPHLAGIRQGQVPDTLCNNNSTVVLLGQVVQLSRHKRELIVLPEVNS